MSYEYRAPRRSHLNAAVLTLLFLGLVLALAGNVYQYKKSRQMGVELSFVQHNLQTQITRLSDATSGAFDVTQHRFEELKRLQDSTAAAFIDTRLELRKSNSSVNSQLEKRNQELAQKERELTAQLAALKQEIRVSLHNTNAEPQNAGVKLDSAKPRPDHPATVTDNKRPDPKPTLSETSAPTENPVIRPVAAVRPAPQPRRLAFDLLKTKVPTRIAEIQIAIRSTDPKNNRYTMDFYAGDKVVRGRDCAINETVQFHLPGNSSPYEIVVNQIRKDEVIGYVSAPGTAAEFHAAAVSPGRQ